MVRKFDRISIEFSIEFFGRKFYRIFLAGSLSPKYRTTFGDAQAKTKCSCPIHESEYPHPKKFSTPAPGAPMGRSSPNYLVPVPGVCYTLSQNFTPIAPSCVEISSTVQTKKTNKQKANLISRQTLRCMARIRKITMSND